MTPRSFSKSRVTVENDKPVSSATSLIVYADFKVVAKFVLGKSE